MNHIETFLEVKEKYPMLNKVASVLPKPPAKIEGRDPGEICRCLRNPEKANVVLLAEPGTGKTACVQGFAYDPLSLESYLVLEINPEAMIGDSSDKDSRLLTGFIELIKEVSQYSKEQNVILVLFIDEFHKIAMISPSMLESLKPVFEKSVLNNFRIIAATTFREYNDWIACNRAFDQRFVRITLPELPRDAVLSVLKGRLNKEGVQDYASPELLDLIYDESKAFLQSNAQPRASLDILMSMIGEVTKQERMVDGKLTRIFYEPNDLGLPSEYLLDRTILKRVIQRMYSIDIDHKVDAKKVMQALKQKLFNQDDAIASVVRGLSVASCGFGEMDRPKYSFLSCGTTGVGKTEMAKIISDALRIPLKRFDMSRYSDDIHAQEFADDLFHAIWSTPNAYLLLDEVEKSSRKVMNILLQVLDDARLSDSKDATRVASFTGAIINLTTNVGSEVLNSMKQHQDDDAEIDTMQIYAALKEAPQFETAVLGRIDAIVPFRPLPQDTLTMIATREIQKMFDVVATRDRQVYVSPLVIPYIVKDKTSSDGENGGARDVKRNIRNLVVQKVSYHMVEEVEDAPLMIYMEGTPRCLDKSIADVNNSEVCVGRCHRFEKIIDMFQKLGNKWGVMLDGENIFFPEDKDLTPLPLEDYGKVTSTLQYYAAQIKRYVDNGYYKFTCEIDFDWVKERDVVVIVPIKEE